MKKVGIVTGFDRYNYGNRLQNYAVQTVLRRMGMECRTIVPEALIVPPMKERAQLAFKAPVCAALGYRVAAKRPDVMRRYNIDRFNRLIAFDAVRCEGNRLPESLSERYDAFVAGSDQVWNPYFWNTTLGAADTGFSNHLLCFARPEQRMCFSPSIGVNALPEEWNDRFRDVLMTYRNIGVRESEGAALIARLPGRPDVEVRRAAPWRLDAAEWAKVARHNDGQPKRKYALYMLLGKESEEIAGDAKRYLDDLLRRKGLASARLPIRKRPELYASGPAEFLDLIRNAELVITDSYHCVIFSFLFGKPFVLFKREIQKYNIDMSSRTNTLLGMLKLERKRYENIAWEDGSIMECDYAEGRARLNEARKATQRFLERSL